MVSEQPDRIAAIEEQLARITGRLDRDAWAGGLIMARQSLPVVPRVTALPTAESSLERALVVLDGTPQILYVCLKTDTTTWTWVELGSG